MMMIIEKIQKRVFKIALNTYECTFQKYKNILNNITL